MSRSIQKRPRAIGRVLAFVLPIAFAGMLVRADQPLSGSGSWSPAGELGALPEGAASAVLPDGRLMIAGGVGTSGPRRLISVFDSTSWSWSAAGSLNVGRSDAAAVSLLDGRVVVFGGTTAAGVTGSIEIFDPATGVSTGGGALAVARTGAAAATLQDGRVLVVGGSDGSVALSSAEVFDPATGTAVVLTSQLVSARQGATATRLIHGHVVVVGGNDGFNDLSSAELFHPEAQTFTMMGSALTTPRRNHAALLLPNNASVLIAGGNSAGQALNSVELLVPAFANDPFEFVEGTFAVAAPMTDARVGGVVAPTQADGVAIAGGGLGQTSAEAFHFATVRTDKDDYAPGEHALITGSGFAPDATVTLTFQEVPAVHADYVLTVPTDSSGNFSYDQWAPEQHDLNVRFYLMADDGASRAQMTFTDAVGLQTITTNTPRSATVAPGASAQYTVNVNFNGNNSTCAADLSVTTPLPPGASASFAQTPVSASTSGTVSTVLTISTSAATPAGTTSNINVRAVAVTGSGCSGGSTVNTDATNRLTLVVGGVSTTTTVFSTANPSTFNEAVSFSATVTPGSGATPPSGTVQFKIDGVDFGSPVTLTPSGSTGIATSGSTSTLTVAGSPHSIQAIYSPTGGFGGSTGALSQNVNAATPTVTFGAAPTPTFGGGDFVVSATTTNTDSPALTYSVMSGPCALVSGSTVGSSGAGACVVQASGAASANFSAASNTQSVTIAKASSTTTVTCPASVVYSGSAQTPCTATVTGAGGLNLTPTPTYSANTNVGTAAASYTFAGDANHDSSSDSTTFAITKAATSCVVTGYDVTYNGGSHTATGSCTGVGNDGTLNGLDLAGTVHTTAGTYSDAWTFVDETGNYNDTSGTVTDKIAKANATIKVTPYSVTYNGSAHTATATAVGVNSEDLAGLLDLSGTTHTNAGDYATDGWSFAGNANYNTASGTVHDVILKASATISVAGYTGVYDGAAHGATGSATGVQSEDLSSLLNLGSSFTDAPGGTANWTFAGNSNYHSDAGAAAIAIAKASSTTAVSCPASVTYSGAAQEPCTASVIGVGGLSQALTVGYSNNTNAGTANASASFGGDANHEGSNGAATFAIDKANASCDVTAYDVTYDGNAHTTTGSCVGVNEEPLSGLDLSATRHTDAGSYNDAWSFTDVTGNYNNSSGSVVDKIAKATAIVSVIGYSGVYDGAAHGATGSAAGIEPTPADLTSLLHLGSSFTDAPGGTASWTFDGNGNYNPSNGTAEIAITKASSTVTLTGGTFVYDGNPHAATAVVDGVGTGVTQTVTFSYSGSCSAAPATVPEGTTCTARADYAGDGNHDASFGTAAVAITKASSATVVTVPGGASFTYDGVAHPATVAVSGVGGLTLTPAPVYGCGHAPKDFADSGCAASYNYAGDANHDGSSDSKSYTIVKASLAITASTPAAITYGDAAPTVTPGYAGFVAGEGVASLATPPACGTNYTMGAPAADYTTTCSGAAAANYSIGYVAGSLHVNKKGLTITADNKSKPFDGTPFTGFTAQYAGFVLGENQSALGGTLTFTGPAVTATAVGTHTITPAGRTSGNYAIAYVDGTLSITAWALDGFYQPVGTPNSVITAANTALPSPMPGTMWNAIKGGQTVPLKFRLFTGAGGTELTSVSSVQIFTLIQVGCAPGPEDVVDTFTTTGSTLLRYDGTQFVQNWDSPKGAGKCYRVTMTAKDGSSISAFFKAK